MSPDTAALLNLSKIHLDYAGADSAFLAALAADFPAALPVLHGDRSVEAPELRALTAALPPGRPVEVSLPVALITPELTAVPAVRFAAVLEQSGDFECLTALRSRCPGVPLTAEIRYRRGGAAAFAALWRRCGQTQLPRRFGCTEDFSDPGVDSEFLRQISDGGAPFPGGEPCGEFHDSCFIRGDGEVFPCRGCRLSIGNRHARPVREILLNSHVRSYFCDFAALIKSPCRECAEFGHCGGCRGRAWRYSGDFCAADPACPANQAARSRIVRLPVGCPEKYLPHQKPILMIGELLAIEDNRSSSSAVIAPDNPFLDARGELHPAALIELAAQGMAFLDTFTHPGQAMQGALIEVRRFSCSGTPLPVGTRLRIESEKVAELLPFHIGMFKIYRDDAVVAEGELKVCQINSLP